MSKLLATTRTRKRVATQRYLWMILLLVGVVVFSSAVGFIYRTNALLDEMLVQQARAITADLQIVRRWIGSHGGVYLRQGDDSDNYVRHNAAQVTQMLSRLSHESGIVKFAAVSLQPMSLIGQADDFERRAIDKMRLGEKEVYEFSEVDESLTFRYMTPLVSQQSCLRCHMDNGFKPGRVDSGISIEIPAGDVQHDKHVNRLMLFAAGIGVVALVGVTIWWLARRFVRQLNEADERLDKLATEDALTGLMNRRMGMELLEAELARCGRKEIPLSVVMLDVDHFKHINDNYGHHIGDEALVALAGIINANLRKYDLAFRFGGEEFFLVLPDTAIDQAHMVSERLRKAVEENRLETELTSALRFTISLGIEQLGPDMDMDTLLAHADIALYAAKENGRNQSRVYEKGLT